jgi:hypothetical protein
MVMDRPMPQGESTMKRKWITGALAAASLAIVPASGALASASASPTARAAKSCSNSYTKATIGGTTKCLRRGEYCAMAYKSQYRHYGFTCSGSPARLH